MLEDFSSHQQKIIKRYYSNQEKIQLQKLAELVTELYLTEGKKLEKMWQSAKLAMEKLDVSNDRIQHLMTKKDPALVAGLVKELFSQGEK